MSYDYDPFAEGFLEEYYDSSPVSLDKMIRYVYDTGDFASLELEDLNNQHIQEAYATEPVSFLMLTPDSKLFVPGDYPERFSQWFFEMLEIINEITKEISPHE